MPTENLPFRKPHRAPGSRHEINAVISVSDPDPATDLDALVVSALAVVPADNARQPYLAGLSPEHRTRVEEYLAKATADATLRAYRSDWRMFGTWCQHNGYQLLPATPVTVAAFLTDLADLGTERTGFVGLAASSIGRRLAAIVFAHRVAGHTPPTEQPGAEVIEQALKGVRRNRRVRKAKKRPADGDVLRDMLRTITGDELRAVRDRALLAIGMGGAFRRSELVAIHVEHIVEQADGLLVTIPVSKTDQAGQGQTIAIPNGRRIEPVRLYQAWRDTAEIVEGPLFRKLTPQGRLTAKPMSAQGVALIVKRCARLAGYDEAQFSGHSLRAGFLTEAGRQNANIFKMKDHSRHKSLEMLSEYVRDQELMREHAGEKFL